MLRKNWFKLAVIGLLLVMIAIGSMAAAFAIYGNGGEEEGATPCEQLVEGSAWIIEVENGIYYTDAEPSITEEGFLLVSSFCKVYDNGDTRQGAGDILNGDWIIYPRGTE